MMHEWLEHLKSRAQGRSWEGRRRYGVRHIHMEGKGTVLYNRKESLTLE